MTWGAFGVEDRRGIRPRSAPAPNVDRCVARIFPPAAAGTERLENHRGQYSVETIGLATERKWGPGEAQSWKHRNTTT